MFMRVRMCSPFSVYYPYARSNRSISLGIRALDSTLH
jgi:hypothetical protein